MLRVWRRSTARFRLRCRLSRKVKGQGAGLPRHRLPRSSLVLRHTSTTSFGKPRTGKVVERLEGYIEGLPSAPLIASRADRHRYLRAVDFDKLRLNFDDIKARKAGTSNHTPFLSSPPSPPPARFAS